MKTLSAQADFIANYLVGRPASNKVKELYEEAITLGYHETPSEDRVLNYWLHHPRSLEALDSGLALVDPNAELRRRVFIMFAILESFPEYSESFLSKKARIVNFEIIYTGIRAVCMAIIGVVLVKVVQR